ncbi:MAG: ATP12 family protein [Pseudomonadota bacterium]
MAEWKPRRFWQDTSVSEGPDGFHVLLDGKTLRTPAKIALVLPTHALAEAVEQEWRAQGEVIDPATMPYTRTANSAVEKVAPQHLAIVEMLAEYGDSDVTCYRAEGPASLVHRQSQVWDPLLDWAGAKYAAPLSPVTGVMHAPQARESLERLKAPLIPMNSFQLAAAHDLITLSGSLVIALATIEGVLSAPAAWDASRVDEDWQMDQWGEDAEARHAAEAKKNGFLHAHDFFQRVG